MSRVPEQLACPECGQDMLKGPKPGRKRCPLCDQALPRKRKSPAASPLLPLVREMRKALLDVYSSIPGTYDESDPMVRCHAKALNAIPTILARADKLLAEPQEGKDA